MENICEEVQRVCSGTSDRFVPEPSQKYVQYDLLIAIRIFKNVFWWKEFWRDQKQSIENYFFEGYETRFRGDGLNNGLNPTFGRHVPQNYVTKTDVLGGPYHIYIFVFLAP